MYPPRTRIQKKTLPRRASGRTKEPRLNTSSKQVTIVKHVSASIKAELFSTVVKKRDEAGFISLLSSWSSGSTLKSNFSATSEYV